MEEERKPKKIVLTRHRSKKIEENLQPLMQNVEKKKFAQDIYYEADQNGYLQSMKGSVHNRLGKFKIMQRRNGKLNRVNQYFFVKPRRRVGQPNGLFTKKYRQAGEGGRVFAQRRLELIRNQFQQSGKKIVLRRNVNPMARNHKVQNLTVEVLNSHFQNLHSVNGSLDPKLQADIRAIEENSSACHVIPDLPIIVKGSGFTKIAMHERFSSYP